MATTAVREKPILFTPENVRAIIDGRKTQTRRIVKPQPSADIDTFLPADPSGWWGFIGESPTQCIHCPYGEVGDKLWVRESWMPLWDSGCGSGTCLPPTGQEDKPDIYKYRADGEKPKGFAGKWRHARYMPRVASRIALEITGVRVERLTDISNNDAIDEGCPGERWYEGNGNEGQIEPWEQFRDLWESINGPGSWAANSWVWVIEFQLTEPR